MDSFIERTKEMFWLMISAVLSVVTPVGDILILLFSAFVFNIVTGIITDVHVNKAKFNIKKAFNAVTQLTFWAVCVVFLDNSFRLTDDPDLGVTAVKWLSYIVTYFYLTNIFKNAKQVYPNNAAIQFVYELLTTEIFDRLKHLVGSKK